MIPVNKQVRTLIVMIAFHIVLIAVVMNDIVRVILMTILKIQWIVAVLGVIHKMVVVQIGSVYVEVIRCTSNRDYEYEDNPCSNCSNYPAPCNANT